ncbi:Serine/threonine-protein kinase [Dimargaris cristalligena]|nr:Serine/threonine-protein kinase [Dimargaris cristalligena]
MSDGTHANRVRTVVRVGDYVIGSEIGRGSFASVYKGYNKITNLTVAIKSVARSQLTKKLLENLESEIAILKKARHENVVELLDCLEFPVLKGEAGGLKEPIVRHFLNQLASALEFLQARKIIHRDIKPQNLLLCPPTPEYVLGSSEALQIFPNLKVADFGFARSLPSQDLAETLCGSPLYMAPEILGFQKYSAKADLWSTGAVLYEMIAGRPPFRAANHIDLLRKIELTNDKIRFPGDTGAPTGSTESTGHGGHYLPPASASPLVALDLQELVRAMLKRHPEDRISFEAFFQHPVLRLRASLSTAMPILAGPTEPTARTATPNDQGPSAVAQPASGRSALPAHQEPDPRSREDPVAGGLARDLDELLNIRALPSSSSPSSTPRPREATIPPAMESIPLVSNSSQGSPHLSKRDSLSRASAIRENAPPTAEKEYVMVDKRTVEVNILADELASSPKSGRGRLTNTQHHPPSSTGPSPSLMKHHGKSTSIPMVFPIADRTQQLTAPSPLRTRSDSPPQLGAVGLQHGFVGQTGAGTAFRGPSSLRSTATPSGQPPQLNSAGSATDMDEQATIAKIQDLTTKAQAVTQLADQKLGYVEDLLNLPHHQRQVQRTGNSGPPSATTSPAVRPQTTSSAHSRRGHLTDTHLRVQTSVEESFALYHRALSLLEIGLYAAERHWSRLTSQSIMGGGGSPASEPRRLPFYTAGGVTIGGGPSKGSPPAVASVPFNNTVQLARHQFNICEERAEYVKSKSPTDELVLTDLSIEQMLHDAALQTAKHALHLYRHQEFILCERGYQWAIDLLEALLEPVAWTSADEEAQFTRPGLGQGGMPEWHGKPALKLDPQDQARAHQYAPLCYDDRVYPSVSSNLENADRELFTTSLGHADEEATSSSLIPKSDSNSPEYALVAKLTNVKPLVQLLKAIHFKKQTHCVLTHRGVKFSVEDSRSVQAHAYLQRQFFSEFRFGPHWHRGPLPNSSRGGGGHPNSAGREAEDTRGAGLGEGEEEEELEMVFALDLTVLLQCLTIFSGTAGNALAHSANTPANSLDGTGGVGGGIPGGPVGGFGNPTSAHARYKSNTSLGWVVNDKGSEVELVLEENEVISVCKLATFESEEITDFQFQVHPIQHRLIIKVNY